MKAMWRGRVVADAPKDQLIYIEQNWYFPPASVKQEFLRRSDTPYTCPWKGVCQYFDVGRDSEWSKDSAWCYPQPKPSALEIVKKDFSGYIAFWRDVAVIE